MADPILKFPPEQKGNPAAKPRIKIAAEPRRRLMAGMRRYRRALLLVVLPLVALLAGLTFYLNGGRYVTTDDAYVGAQKVLITPDVSGKIISVAVKEGQQVSTGDVLFQIDPVPFRARGGAGARQAGGRQVQPRQSRRQRQALWPDDRHRQRRHRPQAARRRPQDGAGQEQFRLAARPRQQRHRAGHRAGPAAARQAAAIDRAQPAARQSRAAARAVSGLHAGQGRARRRPAQSRSDHRARADGRRRHPGRPDPARPLHRRGHAGVLHHRHRRIPGSTPIRRNPTSPMSRSASRSPSTSTPSPITSSRARSARSAPAPARNSRSCRRRTPPAISSRWCSACRCGSISTATTNTCRS